MINFDTDNIILVCYPYSGGGKFLVNSLGLSPSAVFQDAGLVQQQLSGTFTPQDKFTLLQQRLKEMSGKWNDLELGCKQLFGVTASDYQKFPPDGLSGSAGLLPKYDNVVDQLSNSGRKFFMIAHYPEYLDKMLRVWKNAQVILFDNYVDWILTRISRDPKIEQEWIKLRGPSWPEKYPMNKKEFDSIDVEYQDEIKNNFTDLYNMIFLNHNELCYAESTLSRYKTDKTIMWDTETYRDRDRTVTGIEKLYQQLELEDFNKEYISDYYDQWTKKINKFKEKP